MVSNGRRRACAAWVPYLHCNIVIKTKRRPLRAISEANIVTKNLIRLAPATAIRWMRASIESFVKVVAMSKRICEASLQQNISIGGGGKN
jgi:hypothetical protein